MEEILKSGALLLALLNPFLVIIYLVDLVRKLDQGVFFQVMIRAALIASIAFCCFAILGDVVFSTIIQAEFASFQIFGGVVFLLIAIQFVFQGPAAIEILRGESKYLAGAVAMPVLIGPGTISASVIIGKRLTPVVACVTIIAAVAISITLILVLKALHDYAMPRRASLIDRYIEVAGRITALYVGTVAVEMIMRGLHTWAQKF